MKLKVNDNVFVSIGKDKGKTSKITKVLAKKDRVVVEGINKYKRHLKKRGNEKLGTIIEIERPMQASKVQLICPHCKKPTRIGYKILKTGEKYRICRKCSQQIENTKKA